MSRTKSDETAEKLRIALEMFGLGESMMRQNIARTHPKATPAEVEARLAAWLSERPGAPDGDAPGRVRRPSE